MPLLFVLFLLVPIVEIWAIIQVGGLIGVWPTIALLIADSLLGAWLLRHQGRAAWRRLREAVALGRVPATETADGALVILGGSLLLCPGFVTDIFGIVLLIPPTRAFIRRVLLRRAVTVGAATLGGPAVWTVRGAQWGTRGAQWGTRYTGGRGSGRPTREYDVDGTATEVPPTDPPALP